MKRPYKVLSAFLIGTLLTGCTQAISEISSSESFSLTSTPDTFSSSQANNSSISSTIPNSESADSSSTIHSDTLLENNSSLPDHDSGVAVSEGVSSLDFLTPEQQQLYQDCLAIAPGLFGMSGNLTYLWGYYPAFLITPTPSTVPTCYELYDVNYEDFSNRMLTYFTADFLSRTDYEEKFMNYDGKLIAHQTLSNNMPYGTTIQVMEAYPDTYRLEKSSTDCIEFSLISHYDRNGWNGKDDEMDVYIIEYPIRMIKTENGWRMDEFHSTEHG